MRTENYIIPSLPRLVCQGEVWAVKMAGVGEVVLGYLLIMECQDVQVTKALKK